MKAFLSACTIVALGAASSLGYAPVAQARQFCPLIIRNCHTDECQARYEECVANGGTPVTSPSPMKANDD